MLEVALMPLQRVKAHVPMAKGLAEQLDPRIAPAAGAEAVLTEDEKELGTALIDIGGGTTDLAIFEKGAIWHTAVLPVGGKVCAWARMLACCWVVRPLATWEGMAEPGCPQRILCSVSHGLPFASVPMKFSPTPPSKSIARPSMP